MRTLNRNKVSKILFAVILFTSLLLISISDVVAGDPLVATGNVVSATILGKSLKATADKLAWSLEGAMADADYSAEKTLRGLGLILKSLEHKLSEEMAEGRSFVSIELAELATKLSEIADQPIHGLLEIQNFAVLDVQSMFNQIPFKKDLYLVRRIDGYGVPYQENGSYRFRIIGNAFQPGNRYTVTINHKQLAENSIFGGRVSNTLQFMVPTDILNNEFLDDTIARVSLVIKGYKKGDDKPFFNFEEDILLLPKIPVIYDLKEYHKGLVWSTATAWKPYTRKMGPSKRKKRYAHYVLTADVSDPKTERFTGKFKIRTSGSHSKISSPEFSDKMRKATIKCKNQCHDCSRYAFADLEYQWLEPQNQIGYLFFEEDEKKEGLLPYGTYSSLLSPGFQSFDLKIEYFNGKKITIHKKNLKEYGVRAYIDRDEKSDFIRLVVTITDPMFPSKER